MVGATIGAAFSCDITALKTEVIYLTLVLCEERLILW